MANHLPCSFFENTWPCCALHRPPHLLLALMYVDHLGEVQMVGVFVSSYWSCTTLPSLILFQGGWTSDFAILMGTAPVA
jgi:hypothetical protein